MMLSSPSEINKMDLSGSCMQFMDLYNKNIKQPFLPNWLILALMRRSPVCIVAGDFDIMRRPEDKSKDTFNPKCPKLFNAVIEVSDLKEIEMTGHQFTWVRPGDDPTFEKLDRVLVSTEWKKKFPLTVVEAMGRSQSDHTPLILNPRSCTHSNKPPLFKFERGWFLRDGFFDMVVNIWQSTSK